MRLLLAAIIAGLSFQAQALTLSGKDRAFIGGALAAYVLMSMKKDAQASEDPCWRGGWDDGTPCYPEPRPSRGSNVDFCPTVSWCFHEYDHPTERNACVRGAMECVREAERIDWQRVDDAYSRGRGR
jgi:hypothetical protein